MTALGTLIPVFLSEAEEGLVRGPGGRRYTRAQLHELRGALAHVTAELGTLEVETIDASDVQWLVDRLDAAELSRERVRSVIAALRAVYAHAISLGMVRSSPLVGFAMTEPVTPSPTDAMLAFGQHLVAWTVRLVVIAFLAVALGLALVVA
jgi:hypothetical protein